MPGKYKKADDPEPHGRPEYAGKFGCDSMGFRLDNGGHIDGTKNAYCRECRIQMGMPVGTVPGGPVITKPSDSTKRPPKEVHIKDVETALHNVVCRDANKAKNFNFEGYDLFDHRKAATGLIEQLKLQGIKLVPDPDFEDKKPVCRHLLATTVRSNPELPFKERIVSGYKCIDCKAEAKFS